MKKIFLLLLFCHVSSLKHFFEIFGAGSSGIPNLPEFMAAVQIDGIEMGYCDTNTKTINLKHGWVKIFLYMDVQRLERCKAECFVNQPRVFNARISSFMHHFNQSG
ncbi:major histocompatibility complex class I-related gene protein-like isoform X1, partial [Lates japonicus]